MDAASQIGPAAARELRSAVRAAGRRSGLGPGALDRAELAVWEAAVNAAEHGRTPVQVSATGGGSMLTVCVLDTGAGPGSRAAPADDYVAERGRGMALIRAAVDGFSARVEGPGWCLELLIVDRDEVCEQPGEAR